MHTIKWSREFEAIAISVPCLIIKTNKRISFTIFALGALPRINAVRSHLTLPLCILITLWCIYSLDSVLPFKLLPALLLSFFWILFHSKWNALTRIAFAFSWFLPRFCILGYCCCWYFKVVSTSLPQNVTLREHFRNLHIKYYPSGKQTVENHLGSGWNLYENSF